MRISIFPLIAVLTLATVASAQSDAERARIELEKGYALRKEGKFAEALPLLVDSYKLAPQLKTLINLADCEESLGRLADASADDGGVGQSPIGTLTIESRHPVVQRAQRGTGPLRGNRG